MNLIELAVICSQMAQHGSKLRILKSVHDSNSNLISKELKELYLTKSYVSWQTIVTTITICKFASNLIELYLL